MNKNSLMPFESTSETNKISVEAVLIQHSPFSLSVEFNVHGSINSIHWPKETGPITRLDELWKTTCFEIFFSSKKDNECSYIEINCSPAGNWNAYSFHRYREGMKICTDITVTHKKRLSQESLPQSLNFTIGIKSITPLEVKAFAPTMVMEFTNGVKSYWAVRHPFLQADFHNKEGWVELRAP